MATILGTSGSNVINGTNDPGDVIFARAGNDLVNANAGNDLVFGELGNDVLVGGLGDDRLNGGLGNDTLNGGGRGLTLPTTAAAPSIHRAPLVLNPSLVRRPASRSTSICWARRTPGERRHRPAPEH